MFNASSGISLIGVVSVNPYRLPMVVILLNIQLSLNSPSGAIPPCLIDLLRSGIIIFTSISGTVPSPLHLGHAP